MDSGEWIVENGRKLQVRGKRGKVGHSGLKECFNFLFSDPLRFFHEE